ncbi:type III restriction protein Res subunit [Leptotrichia hongkongensis]|uniref:Type III restriction protein Res subunit n=1 Tax=Leptotrichia hongkongensis TaxID=554406 RepID=A0A510LBK3_9FUSO|nr:type III restriction protein Res subunit [Leptotrichia hongkongensis]
MSYKNIKVKIYNNSSESFHTKAYLFEKEKYHSVIIGSSNISQSALYSAEEWNVKLTDSSFFNIYEKSLNQFEKLWHSNEAIELTEDFIDEYEKYKKSINTQNTFDYRKTKITQKDEFVPNSMQKRVLEKLEETRENGNKKGLVISATGTGKTYLAAMDIKQFFEINSNNKNKLFETNDGKSKILNIKFLFIAHREELLENAINVFSRILKIDKNEFGRIYGGLKEINKSMIFASIQSLRNYYNEFKLDFFDYIIVDEFHHSMSDSYLNTLSYFQSKFLLGLTATPKRMDGKDILSLCDYNVVDEIGIKEALEEDLIVPFHYFGVNDYMINYDNIPYKNGKYNEKVLLENLLLNTRTDYIVEKINKFGFDGDKLSAIAFCQNIEHAFFMKEEFTNKGYKSAVITANTSSNDRAEILDKFKNKKIEILCVVDILNEGIDIPTINLLLFLRPTMSSTIFIQQIGRGLRKAENKDFVTIIDFIGNHKKDYLLIDYFSNEVDNKDTLFTKKKNNKRNKKSIFKYSKIMLCRTR